MYEIFLSGKAIFLREFWQYRQSKTTLIIPPAFFILSLCISGFVTSTRLDSEASIVPASLSLLMAFSFFLSLDKLLTPDYKDGTLAQIMFADQSFVFFVLMKSIVHWMVVGVPLSFLAVGVIAISGVPPEVWLNSLLVFFVATAIFSLNGMMGAAFNIHQSISPYLPILLILPFYLPVLLFMILCIDNVFLLKWDMVSFQLLLSLLGGMLVLSPLIGGWALRLCLYE